MSVINVVCFQRPGSLSTSLHRLALDTEQPPKFTPPVKPVIIDKTQSVASLRKYVMSLTLQPFMHTFTLTASSSVAVRVRSLAQGHRTSNVPVTSQPAVPPEPHAIHFLFLMWYNISSFQCLPSTCTLQSHKSTNLAQDICCFHISYTKSIFVTLVAGF